LKLRIRTYDAIKVDYDAPARRVGGISDDAPVDQTTERLQDLASAHSVAATTVGLPVDPTTDRLPQQSVCLLIRLPRDCKT